MRVELFDFDLPEERIALRPAEPRESARLLHVRPGGDAPLSDRVIGDLPDLLRPDDLLVFNDTRVLPAALVGSRVRGEHVAVVSLNLHKRLDGATWLAFARPAKKIAAGDRLEFTAGQGGAPLGATVKEPLGGGEIRLRFDVAGDDLSHRLNQVGAMPLPPYIASRRKPDAQDRDDYQTIFAREEGSVAAPTAGLHFTKNLLGKLDDRGIERVFVTLHVGAGTFLPFRADDTDDHVMHAEYGEVSDEVAAQINAARQAGRRIIPVGTTALRLIEAAAAGGDVQSFAGETDIFIQPGYRFRVTDALFTNFHLPRSTLFMLVSALAGRETMLNAYHHAISAQYRFYSYGDACLIEGSGSAP
ncbi:tRNA preQ1(34) S-adenosylmethionine ribosyltransferase-isomerase QueA [Tepidamorphus sp. 3E244]|uniref:tRNA preQ1(34) S-adenosylmethionine ribosyltransferase-isomerase QueA n=1 Tax=Tepidamorphus sp. 3E244 TaxID=3385498 RepID=UPI0038FCF310